MGLKVQSFSSSFFNNKFDKAVDLMTSCCISSSSAHHFTAWQTNLSSSSSSRPTARDVVMCLLKFCDALKLSRGDDVIRMRRLVIRHFHYHVRISADRRVITAWCKTEFTVKFSRRVDLATRWSSRFTLTATYVLEGYLFPKFAQNW